MRAVPFYCPYCGEEDLEPQGATDGEWHCRSCTRSFQLRFAGIGVDAVRSRVLTIYEPRSWAAAWTQTHAWRTPSSCATLAEQAAEELADAPAEEIIRWATDTFGDRICITSSMTDAVIVHLASAVKPGIDVVFLDTGYHFAETIGTRDAVAAVYPINLINVTPSRTVAEQDAELGPRLYGRNPDLCCYLRKVEPLERALTNYDAWITGVRRDETQPAGARPGWWSGTTAADGQGQPDRQLDARSRSTTTSPPTACWSTRWSTTATPRSAARPAPPGRAPARTRAAGAGPGPARPSAASMPDGPLVAGSAHWQPREPAGGLSRGARRADPRAAATVAEPLDGVGPRRGLSVPDQRVAYLAHAAPSLPQVMSRRFAAGRAG